MPTVAYYVAESLDGRIAGPNDSLEFLKPFDNTGEDYGYDRFLADIDSLVFGAGTWRWLAKNAPEWSYAGKMSWVVTHDAGALPPIPGATGVRTWSGTDVRDLAREIDAAGGRRTWLVGGGALAAQFVAADLLHEYHVAIMPAVLGAGPALVDGAAPLTRLTLDAVERTPSGVVLLRYRPVARAAR